MIVENLVVVGLNHMTAPLARRELTSVSKERHPAALREVMALASLDEAVLISTCSRIEVFAVSREPRAAIERLGAWLRARGGEGVASDVYAKAGEDALHHLFRVASGLDSWIIGESEILGQVRRSYQLSFEAGCTGKVLNRAFQSAVAAGKSVRAETGIQTGISSIGGAAALLAHRIFSGAKGGRVVVFGSGEAAQAVTRHLAAKEFSDIWVANRTLEKARAMAAPLGGNAVGFEEGLALLATAQAAVFSVGSEHAVLDSAGLAPMLAGRSSPLFLLDLGMPRNIEERCGELGGVHLHDLDDLKELVRESMEKKGSEKAKAESLAALLASECALELIKSAASRPIPSPLKMKGQEAKS